jgi:hypothetical protein
MSKSKEELVLEYLQNDFNTSEDSDKYIDAMLSISSTSSSLGSEVANLLTSLNDMQRSRLNSLQKELKNGLSEKEKPYGRLEKSESTSNYLLFKPKDKESEEITLFLEDLEKISSGELTEIEKSSLLRKLKSQIKEYEQKDISLQHYITKVSEKNAWNMLLFTDPNKMDKYELEDILLKMKLAVSKHDKKLKETKDYFSKLEKVESDFVKITSNFIEKEQYKKVVEKYKNELAMLSKPDTKEIVIDTAKIKEFLENKLEKLPEFLNEEQRAIVSDFLPMLREYYEDQCSAFIGGKCYLPMAKDLEEFHNSVEKMNVAEFLETSDKLGFTMQHLYLLHWVGEELMKKFQKQSLTLGKSIIKRRELHMKKRANQLSNAYTKFLKGVFFRNEVAHNGIIWQPDEFENAIKKYKKGILLLGDDFSKELKKEAMPKRTAMKLSKKDEFAKKYFNTLYLIVEEALSLYNSRLEYIEELQQHPEMKPATSTLFYLYKKYENGESFSDESKILTKINEIIKKETHE